MPTTWFYPSVVTQYCEVDAHVPWLNTDDKFTQINLVRSAYDLRHISNPTTNDIRAKTYYVKLTGFNWKDLPNTVNGIEASINIRRGGRITDETVALCISGEQLGDNRATGNVNGHGYITILDQMTYGGDGELWGVENITTADLDENFGLILRYQTHPYWCHQSTPNFTHVQLRVW